MNDILCIDNLTFTYPAGTEPLFDNISIQLNEGWTALVGANGSGKTTLLKLVCGLLSPDSGTVRTEGDSYYAEQKTEVLPEGYMAFWNATSREAFRLKSMLGVARLNPASWETLSHGEKKRCQIAAALFKEPRVLAIDEPSNHLDADSRQVLLDALARYRGIGLLVSHDRELMDMLCRHTIFLDPPLIDIRRCNYSTAARERENENETIRTVYESTVKETKKLKKKVILQQEKTSRTAKKRSKRKIGHHDHDAKAKKDLGRLTGKDAVEGRNLKRLKTKLERVESRRDSIGPAGSFRLGIRFEAEGSGRFFPIHMVSGKIQLGPEKVLEFPDISIGYGDKIGLFGNNGTGKSTFIRHLMKNLPLPSEKIIYIPQEIAEPETRRILQRIHGSARSVKGKLMILVSRLGSDPVHILETEMPSPGEVRKLLLAEGILTEPGIILLDEPTNHMDLPSIECIENALWECPCTQLLISHDRIFLEKTANQFWHFDEMSENNCFIDTSFSSL